MKTLIIEDEPYVSETLRLLLTKYCPDIRLIGSASTFSEGYQMCQQLQPELVFCDILLHSEEGTGLQLMQLINDPGIKVIFITGYKEFAVDAFRLNAIDYLLKPINITELIHAVEKAQQYFRTIACEKKSNLHIPTQHGFLVIPFSSVIRCQADGAYTHFFISEKQGYKTSSSNIGMVSEKLPASHFFRVHKTHIVNKAHVVEYLRGEGGAIRMTDNSEVPVSRQAKEAFIKWLS
jgi:two-component system, LytTR family, response regulator